MLDPSSLLAPAPPPAQPSTIPAKVREELIQVGDLIGRVKGMQKATTMGMVIIGFHLRAIRAQHFPSTKKGGRPNAAHNQTGYKTFTELCKFEFKISDDTVLNWIAMADAVEQKMNLTGDDLSTCFQKLPWDWTAEESGLIECAVNAITEGHTQKQILTWHTDFLIDLNLAGTPTKKERYGTNNPTGKNGTNTPKPVLTQEQFTQEKIIDARRTFFGTDQEGRCTPESICYVLMEAIKPESPLHYLPKPELRYLLDHVLKPLNTHIKTLTQ